jgi:hypothetical protein
MYLKARSPHKVIDEMRPEEKWGRRRLEEPKNFWLHSLCS